jgi:hypothetical protein
VEVAHHSREFELENSVETGDDLLGVDLVVLVGRVGLLGSF